MKTIFENIKDMILPAVVFIAVFGLLIAFVFPAIKGNMENGDTKDYSEYQDASAYKAAAERTAPVISYDVQKIWKAGDDILINDAFNVVDADGNGLDLKVLEIKDAAGADLTDTYDTVGKKVAFAKAGSYYFSLSAIDSEKKKTTKTIALVVDN